MKENKKQFFMRLNLDNGKDRRVYEAIQEHDGYATETRFVKEVILDYLDRREAAAHRMRRKNEIHNLPPEE